MTKTKSKPSLGDIVLSTITGLKGTVTAYCMNLNSNDTVLVQPKIGSDGKVPDSYWVNVGNCKVLKKK